MEKYLKGSTRMVATLLLYGVNPPDAITMFADEIEDQVPSAWKNYVYAMTTVHTGARLRAVTCR